MCQQGFIQEFRFGEGRLNTYGGLGACSLRKMPNNVNTEWIFGCENAFGGGGDIPGLPPLYESVACLRAYVLSCLPEHVSVLACMCMCKCICVYLCVSVCICVYICVCVYL